MGGHGQSNTLTHIQWNPSIEIAQQTKTATDSGFSTNRSLAHVNSIYLMTVHQLIQRYVALSSTDSKRINMPSQHNHRRRFLTLYINAVDRTAEIHIQRPNRNRVITCDRVLSSINHTYTLHEGDPSLQRLWNLIKHNDTYTSVPAQTGWGVTSSNGRSHRVYTL